MDYDAIVGKYFETFKQYCDEGKFGKESEELNIPIRSISTDNSRIYKFLMEEYDRLSYKMMQDIILSLLIEHHIVFKRINLSSSIDRTYVIGDVRDASIYPQLHDLRKELVVVINNPEGHIYMFNDHGMQNMISNKRLLNDIKEKTGVVPFTYVNLDNGIKKSDIFNESELSNHKIVRLKEFFNEFFDDEEFDELIQNVNRFKDKANEYLNFEVIKTIKNPTIYSFKKLIERNILNFEYKDALPNIDEVQHKVIKEKYIDGGLYKCLLGKSDFAKSFMTAEWLYSSIQNVRYLDLTAVALGYLKSIEQFLGVYVGCFVDKTDSLTGKPYGIYKNKKDGVIELTKDTFNPHLFELGNLTGFFGFDDKNNRKIKTRNRSFLNKEITDDTNERFIEFISTVSPLRNGYFHKDNIDDWSIVDEARKTAYCAFYLVLGCHEKIDGFEEIFELIRTTDSDSFKLCDFVYNIEPNLNRIPLFITSDCNTPMVKQKENNLKFDEFGIPQYTGIFLSVAGSEPVVIKNYDINNLPDEIKLAFWTFELGKNPKPIEEQISEFKTIFKDGKFLIY